MTELTIILLSAWCAGLGGAVGGLGAWPGLGKDTETSTEIMHGTIAFGGGILLSAVAFALLPRGMTYLSPLKLGGALCLGGLLFCALDASLSKQGGTKAQFMAMLMDYVPEALALGAVFGHDRRLGVLLAAFIGAQNIPEGFNAFRELTASGVKPRPAFLSLLAMSILGPLAASTGFFFLQDRPELTATIMTFASGGILYLLFQDIAPQAKMKKHWTPALGAVLGFTVGVIGKQLIG